MQLLQLNDIRFKLRILVFSISHSKLDFYQFSNKIAQIFPYFRQIFIFCHKNLFVTIYIDYQKEFSSFLKWFFRFLLYDRENGKILGAMHVFQNFPFFIAPPQRKSDEAFPYLDVICAWLPNVDLRAVLFVFSKYSYLLTYFVCIY